jgi:APA family basic amino acid/polyamine antiporter
MGALCNHEHSLIDWKRPNGVCPAKVVATTTSQTRPFFALSWHKHSDPFGESNNKTSIHTMLALAAARQRFGERAFAVHTAAAQRRARLAAAKKDNASLKRVMGPFAMINLGVGAIVGSGIFVLTGVVARETAGPAVVLSYAVAAVAALLSALAYAEMAVRFPSAGGAFAFASGTFGELVAWTVGADLTLEYALSAAAVARGLTSYAAALFGKDASAVLRFPTAVSAVSIDPVALAAVLAACSLLAFGVREASWANTAVNVLNVALILFVVILGLMMFSPANLVPFAPFGAKGIVAGAGIVFFSFVGADSVANAAEECKKPSRDLPAGIVGGIAVATVLYALMSFTLVGMLPYTMIDSDAPFSAAFVSRGKQWAGGVVAAGALTGIATSIFVSLYSQTRLLLILGRAKLLPPAFGRVSARTRTPVVATAVTALGAGLLALLFDVDLLAELVSLGTLAVYTLVCMAVLVRRYRGPVLEAPKGQQQLPLVGWAVGLRLFLLVAASLAAAACFHRSAPAGATAALGALWLCAALSFYLLKPVAEDEDGGEELEEEEQERSGAATAAGRPRQQRRRRPFRMPLAPLLPCLGVAANSFLLGSLGWQAYVRWVVWMALTVGWYVAYGMWRTGEEDGGGGGGSARGGDGGGKAGGGSDGSGSSGGGGAVELGGVVPDRRRSVDPLLVGDDGARQPSSSGGGAGPDLVVEAAAGGGPASSPPGR